VLETDCRASLDVALFQYAGQDIVSVVCFMIGLWALALFRAQPEHREYLWLGAMGLLYPAPYRSHLLPTGHSMK
jgi:hypothetical protein